MCKPQVSLVCFGLYGKMKNAGKQNMIENCKQVRNVPAFFCLLCASVGGSKEAMNLILFPCVLSENRLTERRESNKIKIQNKNWVYIYKSKNGG